jgi:threonine dehydrogenase-like Zn-dependent dehydrogenase
MMVEPRHQKPEMLRKAVALLAAGKIQLAPLLSKVIRLKDIMVAFRLVIDHPDQVIKVAITP